MKDLPLTLNMRRMLAQLAIGALRIPDRGVRFNGNRNTARALQRRGYAVAFVPAESAQRPWHAQVTAYEITESGVTRLDVERSRERAADAAMDPR